MAEAIGHDYEVSSEGAVRHWEIPYARLEHITPTPTEAAAVLSLLEGTQLTGTILTIDAANEVAVIDFTCSMVYNHEVRNADGYNGAAPNSWAAINIGDPIYYDRSATIAAMGLFLTLSPLDQGGGAGINPVFGFVVPMSDADMALYPKGGATASTQDIGIMQVGAGAV